MANVATVSLKLSPEHFAVLRALARAESKSVSAFVRELVVEVLDLGAQAERPMALFAAASPEATAAAG
jgi:hypothetical protein